MRKFLLASSCIVFLSSVSNAQVINKGQKIIGGSIGASLYKDGVENVPAYKNNYINLTATYGKAFKNNTVIGFAVNYQGQNNQNFYSPTTQKTKASAIGAGIFVEKFFPLSNSFSISTNAGIYGGRNIFNDNRFIGDSLISKDVSKGNSGSINFTPSLNYQFSKRLIGQLNMNDLLSYTYTRGKRTNDNPTGSTSKTKYTRHYLYSSFNNGIRLSEISVSFRYILN